MFYSKWLTGEALSASSPTSFSVKGLETVCEVRILSSVIHYLKIRNQ